MLLKNILDHDPKRYDTLSFEGESVEVLEMIAQSRQTTFLVEKVVGLLPSLLNHEIDASLNRKWRLVC